MLIKGGRAFVTLFSVEGFVLVDGRRTACGFIMADVGLEDYDLDRPLQAVVRVQYTLVFVFVFVGQPTVDVISDAAWLTHCPRLRHWHSGE